MSSDIELEHSEEGDSQSQQIFVKCRAKRLFKLIPKLNDAQRNAVKSSVHEVYLKIHRNAVAFHAWYADAISKIKQLSTGNTVQDGFVPSQSTQDFWHSEELHRFCDNVKSEAVRVKQSVSNAPMPQEVHSGAKNWNGVDEIATQQLRDVLVNLKKSGFGVELNDFTSTVVHSKSSSELPAKETLGLTEVSAMNDNLDYKGIGKGCQITGFEHRRIKFEWTRSTPNHEESAIFTMVHMLMYEGQPFKHDDLGSKIIRRYLVLQLAAALVLADMNKLRDKVIEDVTRWVSRKDSVLVTLKAKRKVMQILTKSRSSK